MIATISLNDDKTKELLTEVMVELIKSNRDVLREIMVDALEEVGLASAIADGRNSDIVSEAEIFSILKGEDSEDKIVLVTKLRLGNPILGSSSFP